MKPSKKTALIILALIIAFGLVFFSLGQSYAAHGITPILPRLLPGPFGGKIHKVEGCTCVPASEIGSPTDLPISYGKLIEVGPPVGGKFMVLSGAAGAFGVSTKVFRKGNIEEGKWTIGLSALPPIPCYQIDEVKTAACAAAAAFGLCTPQVFCTGSKGEGLRATIIGTN